MYSVLTWNIEGLSRNIYNLKHFVSLHQPDIIFLSEPQIFDCDVGQVTALLSNEYTFILNSADKFDLDLPLLKSKAHGGTMIAWKHDFDSSITVHPPISPAALPIIFSPPGFSPSIHISVYLPTSGQDQSFTEELSNLATSLQQMRFQDKASNLFKKELQT